MIWKLSATGVSYTLLNRIKMGNELPDVRNDGRDTCYKNLLHWSTNLRFQSTNIIMNFEVTKYGSSSFKSEIINPPIQS
jgi:hypothetical protein